MFERLRQLYRYRVLVEVLVQRELKARYRGTMLGLLWSFVSPLVLMSIYTLVFAIYMRMDMKGYPVFLLAGMLPWNWFVSSLGEGSNSILSNGGLIKKIYLPSEVFPLVYVLSNGVHFLLSIPILLAFAMALGVGVSWTLLLLPVVVLCQLMFTYGVVLMSSALAVSFRDLLHIIPNVVMIGFFVTPIFYPPTQVPEKYSFLLALNPFAYFVQFYRDVFFHQNAPMPQVVVAVVVIAVVSMTVGLAIFERRRDIFAESV